jgi:2-dehydro-3-deoxyphosphogluconate aldolase/(4S)-4-hydroxy-2-oxoglutarate aldolase
VPCIAILRGHEPVATVELAERCWDAGIELVEVPIQDAKGLTALESTAQAASRRGLLVGAGTVYRVDDAKRARDAGANFLVAPGLELETSTIAAEWKMPYLPGVVSPTEVQLALSHGLHTLKLFPAGGLGADWIRALRGPFPRVNFIAVGGVDAGNALEFLSAGAVAVGVGGALGKGSTIEQLGRLVPPTV